MVKTATQTRSIHSYLPEERGLYNTESGEQCLYLAKKDFLRLKPKTTGVLVRKIEIQGGTRKSKSFLRNGTENSVCSCVLHKPKLLILMSLFLVLIP
jgi:ABC-type uncharacterized transport system ATPase subunit